MHLGIEGRVAVVTGGDSGIGLATARILLEEGVRVILSDKERASLLQAAATLPGEVLPVVADLTRPEQVEALAAEARAAFGSVAVPYPDG
jgi:3-oxoacyl-[acyl-carrier protein] reductase